jgi:hypothetical protein
MTTAYIPEPDSLPARISAWLQRNRDEELTPRDIATKFDVPVQGLHFALREAMHHGWITRNGSNGAYAAGPLLPVAGATGVEPAKPAPAAPHANGKSRRRPSAPPDPDAVRIQSNVPLPKRTSSPGCSAYFTLLERMKPGDMVDLAEHHAASMVSRAKEAGIKVAKRKLADGRVGVWKLA